MTECPDTERLLRLEEAADWNATALVTHVAHCSECRQALGQFEAIASVREGVQPDAGFDARVAASLRAMRSASAPVARPVAPRERRLQVNVPAVVVFALATLSAWILLTLSTWFSAAAPVATPRGVTSVLAIAAGAFAAWQALRTESHTIGTPQPH